ncbi:MAG: SDR family NAD(P)-dependent oxidoreductase [Burkholderiaceae bacterium]
MTMQGSPPRFVDRTVLLTGAGGDIGAAIAHAFAIEGARVALLDLDDAALARTVEGWPDGSAAPLAVRADVADAAQTQRAVDQVQRQWGPVAVLVNNAAAITAPAPVGELHEDDWRRALDANLTGAWLMTRACLPAMLQAGHGVIVNIASQLGQVALAGRGAYGVSKAGLLALTRATAVDYGGCGIRAVSLSPGAVVTGRLLTRYGDAAEADRALSHKYPLGRLGRAAEVAAAALFLASDAAGFITGNDLLVDGGYTAV